MKISDLVVPSLASRACCHQFENINVELCFKQVMNCCRDSHGLVLASKNGKLHGEGDCNWRTAQAILALAVHKRHSDAIELFQSLELCWKSGNPVRHPDDSNAYSRDQFIPQVAACYYSNKFGNPTLRNKAKSHLKRYMRYLAANDWKLSGGHPGKLLLPNQIVVCAIARKLGVSLGLTPSLWTDVTFASTQFINYLRKFIVDKLTRALGKPKVTMGGRDFRIPSRARSDIAKAVATIVIAGSPVTRVFSLISGLVSIPVLGPLLDDLIRQAEKVVIGVLDIFTGSLRNEALFSLYVQFRAKGLSSGGSDPRDYYGYYLLFWQVLLMREIGVNSKVQPYFKAGQVMLSSAGIRHRNGPLIWLENEGLARSLLNDTHSWNTKYRHVDTVWERSLDQQNGQTTHKRDLHPRVDYLVLDALLRL